MLVDSAPAGSEEVDVYYGAVHTLDGTTSTLPMPLEDLVAMGAGAYAALEWSSFASNRINAGGDRRSHAPAATPGSRGNCGR